MIGAICIFVQYCTPRLRAPLSSLDTQVLTHIHIFSTPVSTSAFRAVVP